MDLVMGNPKLRRNVRPTFVVLDTWFFGIPWIAYSIEISPKVRSEG
jgi:hypothetical protein